MCACACVRVCAKTQLCVQTALLLTAAALMPLASTALCQIGLLNLRQLGKYATAIKYFSKALGADPSCEEAMLARAECYFELDKQSRAYETGAPCSLPA